ncbi:hypothetical protein D1BOALGB6SA_4789 [Olavius sp. associated proteobacterium Delta 1]|nr:hypothetical protein D1BOALGB6SA_4789 [Olavius sp. associated proteobacterium Delta 1]
MAKIGYLFLKEGKGQGRQIVSQHWVNESTKAHIPAYFGLGYGYQWYRGEAAVNGKVIETFFAWGRGGQFILVLPEFDLVAVFTSRPYDNSYDRSSWRNGRANTSFRNPISRDLESFWQYNN